MRGRHSDLPTDQFGATEHRVGINVTSQGRTLHYRSGATLRKPVVAISLLTGIPLTQSALSQFTKKNCLIPTYTRNHVRSSISWYI